MAELFGFNITRVKPQTDPKQQFSQPQADDGTQVVAAGGFFGSYLDMEGTAKTEQDLIRRYREIALHPECDMAIEDIVNEAITSNENKQSVKVVTDSLPYSSGVKQRIEEELQDEQNEDQGLLDIDFLEFNDLEQDALEDTAGDLEYSALDVDFLDVDFLVDLLDVVEELVKTTKQLADQQETAGGSGEFVIKGANFGKNDDSQYNIFIEDGGIVFYRDVNGVISLKFAAGANVTLDTIVDGYEGIITTNSGDGIEVRIRQVN